MNEHAGPACALSVLIVGVFAVLLHDKNTPPAQPRPTAPSLANAAPADPPAAIDPRVEKAAVESPRPADPSRDPHPPASAPTAEIKPVEPSPAKRAARVEPRPEPAVRRAARRSPAPRRSSATIVEDGETLADIAARTYGTPDAAESIWKANRDQLARRDATLTPGMLLRTP